MKKGLKLSSALLSGLMVLGVAGGCSCGKDKDPEVKLPEARLDTCEANDYSAACSTITADNFDKYAERDDVMYVDLRNATDYNKAHLQNFEMVQFFAHLYGTGDQLFIQSNGADNYLPRYAESVALLEEMFPKNKTIFFMCQSGGRVVHMMKIMEMNGWDMSKIYNIGGMNQYGESKYKVPGFNVSELTAATGEVTGEVTAKSGKYIAKLPTARIDTCEANDYSAACSSITSANFDDYAQMEDVVYVDLRNEADYTKSHLHGFSMIEFFASIYGTGNQLFVQSNGADNYTARYAESVEILEAIFPKDKTILLMCQSGGRVVHMMKIMEKYGWNMKNVYNIGGMNQYSTSDFKIDNFKTNEVTPITFKVGTVTETSFGHDYTTTVKVALGADNKIAALYVGGECSDADTWADNYKWYDKKDEFVNGLIGKTVAEVQAKLGSGNAASGADVVTGATLSSNRVLKAIVAAFAE